MHIAICDDTIVDRNRLEKLLHRESDARIKTTGVLYIDAYGNMEALLKTPMLYDLFFIDRTLHEPFGLEAAAQLRALGVSAPIVMCCSKIPYREAGSELANLHFIDKPFDPADLTAMVSIGYEQMQQVAPRIEIRGNDTTTHYILPEEWVYAYQGEYQVNIVLSDGRTVYQQGTMSGLIPMLEPFSEFAILGNKYVVNMKHIITHDHKYAIMSDGKQIKLTLFDRFKLK